MSWQTKHCFLPRVISSYWPIKFHDSYYSDFTMIMQLACVMHISNTQDRAEFIYPIVYLSN